MPGREQHQRGVGQAGDLDLALADADGLDQDHVAAGGVEHPQRLRRRPGQAAEVPAGGHRADVDAAVGRVVLHPHPVAEQRAAGERRRRVDREHADPLARRAQPPHQRGGRGRLADARASRSADDLGVAGVAARARPSPRAAAARRPRPARSAGRPPARRRRSRARLRPARRRSRCVRTSGSAQPCRRDAHEQGVALAAAAAQRGRTDAAAATLAARARGAARSGRRTCRSGGRARSRRR